MQGDIGLLQKIVRAVLLVSKMVIRYWRLKDTLALDHVELADRSQNFLADSPDLVRSLLGNFAQASRITTTYPAQPYEVPVS